MSNLKILLTFNQNAKSVPYPAVDHKDGTHTHAFVPLKGNLDLVGSIQEAKVVPAYTSLLNALNAAQSPFFSIGCEKTFRSRRSAHWASGYMEFAFNYPELLGDASNYFSLFYHFNYDAAAFIAANSVQFHWIIQPARFTDCGRDGFTCAVWMTTAQCDSAAGARAQWDAAVNCLSGFITDTEPYVGVQMYAAA